MATDLDRETQTQVSAEELIILVDPQLSIADTVYGRTSIYPSEQAEKIMS